MNKDIFCPLYIILLSMLLNMCAGEGETKRALGRDISHVVDQNSHVKFLDNGNLLCFFKDHGKNELSLKIIEPQSLECVHQLKIDLGRMYQGDVCFLPERNIVGIISAFNGFSKVCFFDGTQGQEIKKVPLGWAHRFCGQTADQKRLVVSTSNVHKIALIDLESLEVEKMLEVNERTYATAHCPQRKLLASGFDRSAIALIKDYSIAEKQVLKIPVQKGSSDMVRRIAFSPDGAHLAVLHSDGLFVWDIKEKPHLVYIRGKSPSFTLNSSLAFLDKANILFREKSLFSLRDKTIEDDDRFKGEFHSSNGKGDVVFSKAGAEPYSFFHVLEKFSQE